MTLAKSADNVEPVIESYPLDDRLVKLTCRDCGWQYDAVGAFQDAIKVRHKQLHKPTKNKGEIQNG